MSQKYLYNGKRVRLIQSVLDDAVVDIDNPIIIYDRKIESEVGRGKQLSDGTYIGYVACGMHGLDTRGFSLREFAQSAYNAILESEKY